MKYVRSVHDILLHGKVFIYGSGARGIDVYQDIIRDRPQLEVVGFLDSSKSGVCMSLPVIPVAEYISRVHEPEFKNTRIIIASTYYQDISRSLDSKAITDYYVYLEDDECVQYVDLPDDSVVENIGIHCHPLAVAEASRNIGEKIYYNCAKFSSMMLRPSGVSFCCWIPDLADGVDPRRSLDRLKAISDTFVAHSSDGLNEFCLRCPELVASTKPPVRSKLTNVDIDISIKCNLKCSYCRVSNTIDSIDYDYKSLLDYAISNNYFENKFSFSMGGFGEPVLNEAFEGVVGNLLAHEASGLIYTNAVKHSELIEEGLRAGLVSIVPSVDAGVNATYRSVRGVDKLDVVWRNISRYARAGANAVLVKYVVTENNCALQEISSFIDRCVNAGVKSLCVSKDFYETDTSDCVVTAATHLARLAKENGISYFLHKIAFSQSMISDIEQMVKG